MFSRGFCLLTHASKHGQRRHFSGPVPFAHDLTVARIQIDPGLGKTTETRERWNPMDAHGVNCSRGKTHGENHSENDQTRGGFATSAASLQLHPEHHLRDRGPGSGTVESPTVLLGAFGAVPIGIATQTAILTTTFVGWLGKPKYPKSQNMQGYGWLCWLNPLGSSKSSKTPLLPKRQSTCNIRYSLPSTQV